MYPRDFTFNLGAAGLTAKAVLRASNGTLHATFRDVALAEIGGGVYHLTSTTFPSGYRGALVVYTGTLGVGTTLAGVTVKVGAAVNPEEGESIANIEDKTDTITGDVTIVSPVDIVSGGNQLNLIAGDGYETATRIPKWTIANYAGPDLTGGSGKLRFAEYSAYKQSALAPAVLIADATVGVAGTTVTITAPLSETQTATLKTPPTTGKPTHVYQLIVSTAASEDVTVIIANAVVTRRVTLTP